MPPIKKEINPDLCTGCSACTVSCPVAQAAPEFPGPKIAGPVSERFRLSGVAGAERISYCSNCKNCDIACPRGVPVSLMTMAALNGQDNGIRPSLNNLILANGPAMARVAGIFPHFLVKFAMESRLSRLILDGLGIDKRSPLPVFAGEYFPDVFKKRKKFKSDKKVVLFSGCFINFYDPETGTDFVDILEKAGYEVILPEGLVCCGLPMAANGFAGKAAKNAAVNYGILKKYCGEGIPVTALCPSCALMLTREYGEMFPEAVSGEPLAVADACSFIASLMEKGELEAREGNIGGMSFIYHAPCHLRAAGDGLPGYELLKRLAGDAVKNASAGCCGIAGSYGFKKGKYEIGIKVGRALFDEVKKSGASLAVSECGTCRVQITGGTGVRAAHPVSVVKKFTVLSGFTR